MLPGMRGNRLNETIKMDCGKVVDTVDIEDMGDKGVFCRYRNFLPMIHNIILLSQGVGSPRSSPTVTGPMQSTTLRLGTMLGLLLSRNLLRISLI